MSTQNVVVESPWVYNPVGNVVEDSKGNRIADLRGWGHLTGTGALNLPQDEAVKVQEARGVMLAAAPDLLAAAAEVMRLLEEHGPSIVPHLMDTDENAGQRLRGAIAKAEGRS